MRFPVCVTGGEPLEQGDLAVSLIDELLKYTSVVLETNGAHLVPSRWMGDDNMCLSVDCKGPSSGVKECDMLFPYESLTKKDQMKFVIANHEDMLFLEKKLQEIFHIETNIIVTPAGGISESLAADILDACNKKKTHGAFYNCASTIKILPQMHKIWRVK
jgi:7-carboxy-7-deazaguanine synthase